MTPSHTSKVIRGVEEKELIKRTIGETDKRRMYFSLTRNGKECLRRVNRGNIEMPELLKPVFERFTELPPLR